MHVARREARHDAEESPDEAGFTLVELLVVMVTMAMMISALGVSIAMSMQLQPDIKSRTAFADQAAIYTSQLSDDIANAQKTADITPGAANITCTIAGSPKTILTVTTPTETAVYQLVVGNVSGNQRTASITRTVGALAPVPLLSGYCTDATTAVTVSYADPSVSVGVTVQSTNGSESRTIDLNASRRCRGCG